MILQLELNDKSQLAAIRAFLDALKIKHTIQDDDVKMTKEAYFEMLESSINEAKKREI